MGALKNFSFLFASSKVALTLRSATGGARTIIMTTGGAHKTTADDDSLFFMFLYLVLRFDGQRCGQSCWALRRTVLNLDKTVRNNGKEKWVVQRRKKEKEEEEEEERGKKKKRDRQTDRQTERGGGENGKEVKKTEDIKNKQAKRKWKMK